VSRITDGENELYESSNAEPLDLNADVRRRLLAGMEAVCLPGGTAADLYPVLMNLRERIPEKYSLEFYAKTGTPFRREIRKGEQEIYSSVLLLSAVLRDRDTEQIQDALSFAIYVEDQGEHMAVDFLKQLLGRILLTRRWIG
jgi:hypothetical protein